MLRFSVVRSLKSTFGIVDFRPLKKFNVCNFHIFFTVFDAINFVEKIFDLAKCPLLLNIKL